MADIKDWTSVRQIWYGGFTLPIPVPPENQLYTALKDGATTDLSVDGSSTEAEYLYTCPDNKIVFIDEVNILIVDGGISPTKFGGITALTNGVLIQSVDSDGTTVLVNFTAEFPIKKNADWHLLAGSDRETTAAAGDDTEEVSWSLVGESGPLLLTEGQIFCMIIRDDLRAITEFIVAVDGLIFDDGVFNDA